LKTLDLPHKVDLKDKMTEVAAGKLDIDATNELAEEVDL
jgi:hypothetical protein